MTTFCDKLIQELDKDARNELIEEYLRDSEKRYGDQIQKYKLWSEFLKRSGRFKEVCEWFEEAKKGHPYPDEIQKCELNLEYLEDFFFFVSSYDHIRGGSPLVPLKNLMHLVSLMLDGSEIFRVGLSGTFFSWVIDAGFPSTFKIEMLMNLFIFGNVYADPDQGITLRAVHFIDVGNQARAVKPINPILS